MKVLFILAPNVTIFEKKAALEVSIGGTNAAGVIESHGHDVDLYDLNYLLNTFRDHDLLSTPEFAAVCNPYYIIDIFKSKQELPIKIQTWIKFLADDLPENINSYDAVCVSLNRWMYKYYPSIASFAMTIYLLQKLNVKIPIYVGGEYAYEMMQAHGCLDMFMKEINFISYVRGRNVSAFVDSLYDIIPKKKINLGQVSKPQIDFKVDCQHEYENIIEENFPPEVLKEYPNLNNVNNLVLSPFKFSEGCIFKCAFCPSGIDPFFEKSEILDTVDKLESLVDKGYTDFRFFNDNINFKLKWTIEFANEIVKRNLNIRFSDSANLRIGSKEMFNALKEAGCVKLWYGTETVVPRILKEIHKEVSPDQIEKMLNWSNSVGIWSCCNFIFNFPHETEQEFNQLVDFIRQSLDNNLINAYQANVFKLLFATEYEKYPENFSIKLIGIDNISKMHMFDEINGLSWEQRVSIGEKRSKIMKSTLYSADQRTIAANDFMIFACNRAGYDKQTTVQIIDKVFKTYTHEYLKRISPGITDVQHYEKLFATYSV